MPAPKRKIFFSEKRQGISRLVARHHIPESGLNCIARFSNPTKVSQRIAALKEARVPLTGLVWKLAMRDKLFQELLERHRKNRGFTQKQVRVRDFLLRAGVSPAICDEMARRRIVFQVIKEKIDYFTSIKLDPKKYGVSRIPASMFEKLLDRPLSQIRHGIQKTILWQLEDAQKAKQLDLDLSGWRKKKSLQEPRATRLLERTRTARAQGVEPNTTVLTSYSAKTIAFGRIRASPTIEAGKIINVIERSATETRYPEKEIERRIQIVDLIVSRPKAKISFAWLQDALTKRNGMNTTQFNTTVAALKDLGIVSRKNGFIQISNVFRKKPLIPK